MRFAYWSRELAGWALIGIGLWRFWETCVLLSNRRIFEAGPSAFIAFIIFRGGLHLLKVAVAAQGGAVDAGLGPTADAKGEPDGDALGRSHAAEVGGARSEKSRRDRQQPGGLTVPLVPPAVRAVFFDAVGTLLFPEPPAPTVYAATARRHGLHLAPVEVRERFVTAFRCEEVADVALQWATSEARERDRWRRIVTATLAGVTNLEGCFEHLLAHFARPSAWRVSPDAEAVLAGLHARGFILGMGSNYDARLSPVLDGFPELAPLRERVVISAAVRVRKPGAAFFHEVTRRADCAPGEVLFVGDDPGNDYEGATAAGLHAVLLDPHAKHVAVPHRIARLAQLLS